MIRSLSPWPQRATLLGTIGVLAAGCASEPANAIHQVGSFDACQTVLTTTSSGSFTDGGGNAWTLTAANGAPL